MQFLMHTVMIEKGIPFPATKRSQKATRSDRGRRMRLPLIEMEIGDSIYVPDDVMSRKNLQVIASKLGHDLGRRFRTKTEASGCRIWRLA